MNPRSQHQARCLTIMYHYVGDQPTKSGEGIVSISEEGFERQLDSLCAVLEPIDWTAFRRWRCNDGAIPEQCFLLTFDDGLSDHARTVAPILDARGLKGVFFVSSECLATGRLSPPHQIHALFASLGSERLDEAIGRWLSNRGVQQSSASELQSAASKLYAYESPVRARIKYLLTHTLPLDLRDRMLEELLAAHVGDSAELARQWYMTHEQLTLLQDAGHALGGHGHSHRPFGRLAPDAQRHDVQKMAEWLSEHCDPQLRPFSYPYGSYDHHTPDLCRTAGFAAAFTTRPGWNDRATDPFQLRRIDTIAVDSFLEEELLCPL